jgi:hypothetical protein
MTPEVKAALAGLRTYAGGGDSVAEDALFQVHTNLVLGVLATGATRLNGPVLLWERLLAPETAATEKRLGKLIHKGAPLYNTGVCLFLLNDFDGAFQYFVDADEENKRLGPGGIEMLIGKHALSEKILIAPLIRDIAPKWAQDYKAVTGIDLNAGELTRMLEWLGKRTSDAFATVFALHRISRAYNRPKKNQASRLIVVRSIAELLVVLESAIRRIQGAGIVGQQLGKRMPALIGVNPKIKGAYDDLLPTKFPQGQGESAAALNAVVNEGVIRFGAAKSEAERAGIVCYIAYRLRNSLLHLNEEALDIYGNLDLAVRMSGWALAANRLARHREEGTLTALS